MSRSEPALMRRDGHGFSLAETLVALCVGCVLGAVMLNAFRLQTQIQKQALRQVRERTWVKRALDRIARDVRNADDISTGATPSETADCSLTGRTAVLKLTKASAASTIYSVGAAPGPIWRGTVLMRCAPDPSAGNAPTNRVLIDGLAGSPGSTVTPWTGCSALLRNTGTELAGSYQLGFSACRHPDSRVKMAAVRLQLRNLRYSTDRDKQSHERLVMVGNS